MKTVLARSLRVMMGLPPAPPAAAEAPPAAPEATVTVES
jgi:hypothetical protein